jgi:ABC-2 type transport system ATP-binding protein
LSEDIAIKVEHVSKTFKLPHEKQSSIKGAIINIAHGGRRSFERQEVLKDVSFEIKKGEFFGIVGRNGSGKSTLLKMLAGIYTPSQGSIQINGKLTPFIELGVGFNQELTGRENVFLNGALLGFSRKEMDAMYNDIVSFAELEKFMDQKLKNYSSGMQVRLAFSIAIRAESDILVLDEVLAVGDMDFQQKCFDYFITLKRTKKTVILVTHDMGAVLKFCDRAMLLGSGVIREIATPKKIADAYIEVNYEKTNASGSVIKTAKEHAYVNSVSIRSAGEIQNKFQSNQTAEFTIAYRNPKRELIHFGFQIFNSEGVYCFGTNTVIYSLPTVNELQGTVMITVGLNLVPGQYTVTAATIAEDGIIVYDYSPNAAAFRIERLLRLRVLQT